MYLEGMAGRVTLSVSLPPDLEDFVSSRVASGRYPSASEVVREGLRLLEQRETLEETAVEALRPLIAIGLEQARRGDLHDGDEVFRSLDEDDGS
jgi:antitoxin ParD1/3/4